MCLSMSLLNFMGAISQSEHFHRQALVCCCHSKKVKKGLRHQDLLSDVTKLNQIAERILRTCNSKLYLVQARAVSLEVCIDFVCLAKFQLSLVVKVHTSQVKPIFSPPPGRVSSTAAGEVAP